MQKQEKNWAIIAHLSGFFGMIFPFGNILAPLVIWLLKRDEFPTVGEHAKEALNFQISFMIYMIVSALLVFVLIGFPLLLILGIVLIVQMIKAAIAASNGESYRYPYTMRLVK